MAVDKSLELVSILQDNLGLEPLEDNIIVARGIISSLGSAMGVSFIQKCFIF